MNKIKFNRIEGADSDEMTIFMKKVLLCILLSCMIFSAGCGSGKSDSGKAEILRADGVLYYDTDETGPMGDKDAVAGYIQSSVESGEIPQEDGESNFGCIGNPYTYCDPEDDDDFMMVLMDDDEYHVFKKYDA